MKHSAPTSIKFLKLKRRLNLPHWQVVGLLESIWLFTQSNAPEGDIGRHSNEDIAASIEWPGDPDELISHLVECRWLDEAEDCRLMVHDWAEHCPAYIRGSIAARKTGYGQTQSKTGSKGGSKTQSKTGSKGGSKTQSKTGSGFDGENRVADEIAIEKMRNGTFGEDGFLTGSKTGSKGESKTGSKTGSKGESKTGSIEGVLDPPLPNLTKPEERIVPSELPSAEPPADPKTGGAAAMVKTDPPPTDLATVPPPGEVILADDPEPKTPPGMHNIAIELFCSKWFRKYKQKYPFNSGKDAKAIQWMLSQVEFDLGKFESTVGRFLADDDNFYAAGDRHSLSRLRQHFARWLVDQPIQTANNRFKTKIEQEQDYIMSQIESLTE